MLFLAACNSDWIVYAQLYAAAILKLNKLIGTLNKGRIQHEEAISILESQLFQLPCLCIQDHCWYSVPTNDISK
jgi:hypothetical protein